MKKFKNYFLALSVFFIYACGGDMNVETESNKTNMGLATSWVTAGYTGKSESIEMVTNNMADDGVSVGDRYVGFGFIWNPDGDGMVVDYVVPDSTADSVLKEGDAFVEVNGVRLTNENRNQLKIRGDEKLSITGIKDLLFVCANPDFDSIEKKSNSATFCMGTIAELYNNLGGKTFILGKPSIEIYKKTFEKFANIKKSRILAIGDSLFHDIRGAVNFGVDSLLITSTGIHSDFFDEKNPSWKTINNSLKKLQIQPTYICKKLNF